MPNIIVNNYCNLNCPYCFANDYISKQEKSSITLKQLSKILNFLEKSIPNRIGIIGGEPTIHPDFSFIFQQIINFCEAHQINCTLFSNGIELINYANFFKNKVNCLININHPDIIGNKNWNAIINSLEEIKKQSNINNISFGVNLYPTLKDYDFIFELAKKYNKTSIRVSYIAPTNNFIFSNKESFYNEAKEIFLPFAKKASTEQIKLNLDCNHIPQCYFTSDELFFLNTTLNINNQNICTPVIDITPDFKATACFGAYEFFDLKNFHNIIEVEKFLFNKKIFPLILKNSDGKCEKCKNHQILSCQGGCLAFVKN